MTPPVEKLRRMVRLDPETGRLFWLARNEGSKVRSWNTRYAGKEAMTAVSNGSRVGRVFNRMTMAHRVVFALANGRWPTGHVDHIDGDRLNNRPTNLRECTAQQNTWNGSARGGSSRFKGVSLHKATGRWSAQATVDGRKHHLGYFGSEEAAAAAYDNFAVQSFGRFSRPNAIRGQA